MFGCRTRAATRSPLKAFPACCGATCPVCPIRQTSVNGTWVVIAVVHNLHKEFRITETAIRMRKCFWVYTISYTSLHSTTTWLIAGCQRPISPLVTPLTSPKKTCLHLLVISSTRCPSILRFWTITITHYSFCTFSTCSWTLWGLCRCPGRPSTINRILVVDTGTVI